MEHHGSLPYSKEPAKSGSFVSFHKVLDLLWLHSSLSADRGLLFSISSASRQIRRSSPPSAVSVGAVTWCILVHWIWSALVWQSYQLKNLFWETLWLIFRWSNNVVTNANITGTSVEWDERIIEHELQRIIEGLAFLKVLSRVSPWIDEEKHRNF